MVIVALGLGLRKQEHLKLRRGLSAENSVHKLATEILGFVNVGVLWAHTERHENITQTRFQWNTY